MNLDFNKNNDDGNYGNKTKTKAGNIYQSHILCTKHYSKSVSNTSILTTTFLFFLKNYYLIVILFFGHTVQHVGSQFTNGGQIHGPCCGSMES